MLPLRTSIIIDCHAVIVYYDIRWLGSRECDLFLHFINSYHMGMRHTFPSRVFGCYVYKISENKFRFRGYCGM